jgi:hypothetical protein
MIATENTQRVNKYNYVKVIQQYFGYGWEDVSEYNKASKEDINTLKGDLREYRLMNYPTRVIERKVLK